MRPTLPLLFLLVVSAGPASAQDVGRELAELRQELAALKTEVARLRTLVGAPAPGSLAPADPQVEMLRTQVAEQAQTKVESASRMPVRLSGSIVSTTFVNTGSPNWLDIPNIGNPRPPGGDAGTFSSTLRQSRIGLEASGIELGAWRASGTLQFDFFGGIPAFQTGQVMGLPRLLYAFARFDGPRGSLVAGQDEAIVAPRSPTSLAAFAFPALFRSGNLYLRVPQVRGEARLAAGATGALRVAGGITAPIAGDHTSTAYTFVPPELSGERSERPGVQARAVWETTLAEGRSFAAGVSGHWSSHELPGESRDSWIGAFDFDLAWGAVGVSGEAFAADRAGAYGAALGQQARTRGGWIEARFAPGARWSVVGGAGTDRLASSDAPLSLLRRNTTGFGAVTWRFTPEVAAGVEYFRLVTEPTVGGARRNHHVNWVLRYDF
jgi:hypothetical protein